VKNKVSEPRTEQADLKEGTEWGPGERSMAEALDGQTTQTIIQSSGIKKNPKREQLEKKSASTDEGRGGGGLIE